MKKFGDAVSVGIWFVFYFTLFSIIAVPVRLLTDFLAGKRKRTSFIERGVTVQDRTWFGHEG